MREQEGTKATTLQRPVNDDKEAWKAYWKGQGKSWRTEPEINDARQHYLGKHRSSAPYSIPNLFPFKDIKLSRADVEWLLATHDNGRGPIDWKDEKQREREGLDLRGANLQGVDLSNLPMAGLVGGLRKGEDSTVLYPHLQKFEVEIAATNLEDANLERAHLEGASLRWANLKKAHLVLTHLEEVDLVGANLEGTDLSGTDLERADLKMARLQGASLKMARLLSADLRTARLQGVDLSSAHLEGADLSHANLEGADLKMAFMSSETVLNNVTLSHNKNIVLLADVHWSDVNVAVVDWSVLTKLGEELLARQRKRPSTEVEKQYNIELYNAAVRAYRQLATVLRNQGLNEDAARFAYRAQLMQREVVREQGKFGRYLGSFFLDLLAGYGYRWWRSFMAYLVVILAYATVYYIIGRTVGPDLSPVGAWVYSMTSFHGRGFFPGGIKLDDPLTVIAAIEAFVGLLIEVTFIATLTQRLFGK